MIAQEARQAIDKKEPFVLTSEIRKKMFLKLLKEKIDSKKSMLFMQKKIIDDITKYWIISLGYIVEESSDYSYRISF